MYEYKFTLDRVVDGDTVDGSIDIGFQMLMFKRLRLYGINAPETRTKNLDEKARGIATKEWLEDRLKDKDLIIKTMKDSAGKYGRILADIYVGETNINQEMLDLALAEVYK